MVGGAYLWRSHAVLTVFTALLDTTKLVPSPARNFSPPSPRPWLGRLHTLLVVMVLIASSAAWAQVGTVTVGVITSRSGVAQAVGASQALAASAWAAATARAGGVYGVEVKVEVQDDGGVPATAVRLAHDLIAQDVHVIVCCSTAAASRAVAQVAEDAGVLLLSPTELGSFTSDQAAGYWSFALWPDDTDVLSATVAAVLGHGRGTAALMTLDNDFGERAAVVLTSLLGYAGMALDGEIRYAPGTAELRPEALLIASHLPGAVLVWGLADDLQVAVRALRARGYEGLVYGRSALLPAGGGRAGLGALTDVRFAVPPAIAAAALPTGYVCADSVERVRASLAAAYGGVIDLAAAAPVVDALDLVATGIEQLLAMQLPPVPIATERQALRDALVGIPARCGAGGLLDLQEGRRSAVVPRGLVSVLVGPFGNLLADEW